MAQVYRVLLKYSACVQPISCDEAFVDITGEKRRWEEGPEAMGFQRSKGLVVRCPCASPAMHKRRTVAWCVKPCTAMRLPAGPGDPQQLASHIQWRHPQAPPYHYHHLIE